MLSFLFFPRLLSYWESARFPPPSPQSQVWGNLCAFYLKVAIWKSAEELKIFSLLPTSLYLIAIHKIVKLNICHVTFFNHLNRTNYRQGLENTLIERFSTAYDSILVIIILLSAIFWSYLSFKRQKQLTSSLCSMFISHPMVILSGNKK